MTGNTARPSYIQKTGPASETFGRQTDDPGLCLADYVTPVSSGGTDYVALMVTTIGEGVRALAEEWKDKGKYLRSHVLQKPPPAARTAARS